MIKYLTIAFILLVPITEQAYACKCSGLGNYDVVFEGTVLKIEMDREAMRTERYYAVYFEIEKTLKGITQSKVTIYTGSVLLCGMNYEIGKKYTVYAINDEYLKTKYCYGRELK